MSLILDALRKLERDRHAADPRVVVLGPASGGGEPHSRVRGALVAGLVLGVCLGIGAAAWWMRTPPVPPPMARTPAPAEPLPAQPASSRPAVIAPAPSSAAVAAGESALDPVLGAPPPRSRPSLPLEANAVAAAEAPALRRPELRLNAISVRDGRPVALVNERLMHEGDVFDGIRLLRIGETEVEVEVRGHRRVLTF